MAAATEVFETILLKVTELPDVTDADPVGTAAW